MFNLFSKKEDFLDHLKFIEAIPLPCFIVRKQDLKVSYINNRFKEFFNMEEFLPNTGQFGDIVNCMYIYGEGKSCGYTERCGSCEVRSYISNTNTMKNEVSILLSTESTFSSEVFTLHEYSGSFKNEDSSIIFLERSTGKRDADALERIFYHDIMNQAQGIDGLINTCRDELFSGMDEGIDLIMDSARGIVKKIELFRTIKQVENNNLISSIDNIEVSDFIESIVETFSDPKKNPKKIPILTEYDRGIKINTNHRLLKLSVEALVQNAVDASFNSSVLIGYCKATGHLFIHNEGTIEYEDKKKLFMKYSTDKFSVRKGLGTYMAKLFVEKALGGRITYKSEHIGGTYFSIFLKK